MQILAVTVLAGVLLFATLVIIRLTGDVLREGRHPRQIADLTPACGPGCETCARAEIRRAA